jgi:DNA polymerase
MGGSVAIVLPGPADFTAWRNAARGLLSAGVEPAQVEWRVIGDHPGLFGDGAPPAPPAGPPAFSVPRAFLEVAEIAIRHRDAGRFAALYGLLWRVTHGEHALMGDAADPDVRRLEGMARAVRRDAHKMHAFLRFRQVETEAGLRHVAWFEPEHHIEEAEAGFFVRRFAGLRWTIVTPRRTVPGTGRRWPSARAGRRATCRRTTRWSRSGAPTTPRSSTPPASSPARCAPRCRSATGGTCRRRRRSRA